MTVGTERTTRPPAKGRRAVRPCVMSVFGTRPQLVKLAVVWPLLESRFRSRLVDSGQHYDDRLAASFYQSGGIRQPDACLVVRARSSAAQIGRVAESLDRLLTKWSPDAVVTFGDTSTTAGAAIAAAYRQVPVAHIEAGLRSFDTTTPEEKNRLLTDHLSRWRFCPTQAAIGNLEAEGITKGVYGTGDVMYQAFLRRAQADTVSGILDTFRLVPGGFYLVTCHRAENVDPPDRLEALVAILAALDAPVIFAVHPRARKNLIRHRMWMFLKKMSHVRLTPPLGHADTLELTRSARAVLTDSGGLQREAYWLRTPCLILRDRTEWTGLIECGASRLVGLSRARVRRALKRRFDVRVAADPVFRRKNAAERIVSRLERDLR